MTNKQIVLKVHPTARCFCPDGGYVVVINGSEQGWYPTARQAWRYAAMPIINVFAAFDMEVPRG